MITPDPSFRPNPDRAIYLQGEIDQNMINRHTSEIIKLKHGNKLPVTVYIDSTGGDPNLMERLLKLLLAAGQDESERCSVITVVTSQAASAAVDLLSSGDYAIAYPGASLLYHGIRFTGLNLRDRPLTREWSSILTDYLRERNNVYAMRLAEKIVGRFMFRLVVSKSHFDQIRANLKAPDLSLLSCYLVHVGGILSEQGSVVFDRARKRYNRYSDLLEWIVADEEKRTKRRKRPLSPQERESGRIKALIDFECHDNKGNSKWSFQNEGISKLTDDFFLLTQYEIGHRKGMFSALAKRYGDFFMTDADKQELTKLTEAQREVKKAEKTEPLFYPLWSFFIGLCHALQEDENRLTASDAYWLGLIDEVFGDDSLPSFRMVSEYTHDPQQNLPLQRAAIDDGKEKSEEREEAAGDEEDAGAKA